MLKIRDTQRHAIVDHGVLEFQNVVADLLRHKRASELGGAPAGYLESLLDLSIGICRRNGIEHQGAIIDFAESMVTDDKHPLETEALTRKAEVVLKEMQSREVFLNLQALSASFDPTPNPGTNVTQADSIEE